MQVLQRMALKRRQQTAQMCIERDLHAQLLQVEQSRVLRARRVVVRRRQRPLHKGRAGLADADGERVAIDRLRQVAEQRLKPRAAPAAWP